VRIQGVSVDRNGHLPNRPADHVRVRNGMFGLSIASGSADLITVG